METKQVIKEEFQLFVVENFKNEGIRNFLLNHERLPLLINNLTNEIKKCDNIILGSSRDLNEKRRVVKELARDFSKHFCKAAIAVKEKELANG